MSEKKDFESTVAEFDLQMFAAMRQGLQESVAGEVRSEMAKTVCNFTIELLDRFLIKHTEWPAILQRQIQRQATALSDITSLLNETGVGDAAAVAAAEATLRQALQHPGDTLAKLEATRRELDATLETLAPVLLSDRRLRVGDSLERVNRLLREHIGAISDSEREYNAAMKARAERHATMVGSKVAATREKLQDYLRAYYPERKDIEITSFYELPGGSSKTTILIDVRGFENAGVTPLVVRLDRVAGSTDTRVMDEVPTLQKLASQGLPIPELILVEPDASKIGLAFIIVRKVDAPLGGNMWQVDPQLCDAGTARELAQLLAKLHTLDVKALGLRGARNSNPDVHPMKGLLDNIRELCVKNKMEPDGTLETCLCWLEQHMPPAPPRPTLVHGDVSFHNILVKDKKIACLLDWELSHLGDPIEDLSYARMCIEQLMPWEEFLAEYRRHGGGDYSEETGLYYGIWRGVRNAVYTLTCQKSFQSDANPDMRWGFFATYYRLVLLEAAEKVAKAGMRRAAS